MPSSSSPESNNDAPGLDPVTSSQLLIGEASVPLIASEIARRYAGCPYVHYIAAFERLLVAATYFPESHRWWLEMVAEEPQIARLSRDAPSRAKKRRSRDAPCTTPCVPM